MFYNPNYENMTIDQIDGLIADLRRIRREKRAAEEKAERAKIAREKLEARRRESAEKKAAEREERMFRQKFAEMMRQEAAAMKRNERVVKHKEKAEIEEIALALYSKDTVKQGQYIDFEMYEHRLRRPVVAVNDNSVRVDITGRGDFRNVEYKRIRSAV